MTIESTFYVPVVVAYTGQEEIAFLLENSGASSIEVWIITDGGIRYLMPVQNYGLSLPSNRPLFNGGTIIFTAEVPVQTASISIERNTPIVQVTDYQLAGGFSNQSHSSASFPSPSIEFALDKATMIAQEIAYRKCNAVVTIDMDQLISFTRYTQFTAAMLNGALDKLTAILLEIDTSADDCRDCPEET
jgi:hypothetical protein